MSFCIYFSPIDKSKLKKIGQGTYAKIYKLDFLQELKLKSKIGYKNIVVKIKDNEYIFAIQREISILKVLKPCSHIISLLNMYVLCRKM